MGNKEEEEGAQISNVNDRLVARRNDRSAAKNGKWKLEIRNWKRDSSLCLLAPGRLGMTIRGLFPAASKNARAESSADR